MAIPKRVELKNWIKAIGLEISSKVNGIQAYNALMADYCLEHSLMNDLERYIEGITYGFKDQRTFLTDRLREYLETTRPDILENVKTQVY